jgi:hypothetical protein
LTLVEDESDDDAPQSDYWLGLQIAALPEVAKRQLNVEHGLAVEDVLVDSPAAKAEIKKYDILVKAGDTPLKEHRDLVKAVDASQGKELTITIIRGGKDQTVRVIATKRPTTETKTDVWKTLRAKRPELDDEIKKLELALESLKGKVGKDGVGLLFAKPAVVAPKFDFKFPEITAKGWKLEIPKDMSIQINKQGSQPAKIHVKQGDKEWDVTDDKIDELPEEIRKHIQQLHGQHMHLHAPIKAAASSRVLRVTPEGKVEGELKITPPVPPVPPASPARVRVVAPAAPAAPKAPAAPPVPPAVRVFSSRTDKADSDADSKLDAILKKLNQIEDGSLDRLDKEVKQLRKEIDELRTKSPADRK